MRQGFHGTEPTARIHLQQLRDELARRRAHIIALRVREDARGAARQQRHPALDEGRLGAQNDARRRRFEERMQRDAERDLWGNLWGDRRRRAVVRRQQLAISHLEIAQAGRPPAMETVRGRRTTRRRDGDGLGGGPYAKAGLLLWEDDLRLERQAPKDGLALTNLADLALTSLAGLALTSLAGLALTNLAGLALTNLAGLGVARRMPLGRRIFRVGVAREKHADPPTVFDCSTAYLRWGLTRRIE